MGEKNMISCYILIILGIIFLVLGILGVIRVPIIRRIGIPIGFVLVILGFLLNLSFKLVF